MKPRASRCPICAGSGEAFPTTRCDECAGTGEQKPLDRARWFVEPVPLPEAKAFVIEHHYSGSVASSAVYSFGLFSRDMPLGLFGAAIWGNGLPRTAAETFADDWTRVLSLSRLAIHPDVPTNAASFFIARCVRRIRQEGEWPVLATYADAWQGHSGAIYRATNWEYLGETKPTAVWVDSSGRMVSNRASGAAGSAGLATADMTARGHRFLGHFPKHKFRMVLDADRAKKRAA